MLYRCDEDCKGPAMHQNSMGRSAMGVIPCCIFWSRFGLSQISNFQISKLFAFLNIVGDHCRQFIHLTLTTVVIQYHQQMVQIAFCDLLQEFQSRWQMFHCIFSLICCGEFCHLPIYIFYFIKCFGST